jgi:beta-N-acetylhexosaminidase
LPLEQIDISLERISRLKAAYSASIVPDIAQVRTPEHLQVMEEAARAGVVVLRADPSVFPLGMEASQKIVVIEFASYLESNAMEGGGQIGFESLLHNRLPGVETLTLHGSEANIAVLERARTLAAGCDVLVLATRSAHLIPEQYALAREFLNSAPQTILVCLRNPYDAAVLVGAQTVMCTCGDTPPSIKAVVDALTGAFVPAGRLPVPLEGAVA